MVKKERRSNGEGSVFFIKKKGLWCAQVTVGRNANGGIKRKAVYSKTKAGVLEKKRELDASVTTGSYIEPTRMTLSQFMDQWIELVYSASVRPTTLRRGISSLENHIKPSIGSLRLTDLTMLHLQSLYNQKLQNGLSPRSIRNIHYLLSRALKHAIKWGFIAHSAADAVELPKPRKAEMRVLSLDQVESFLETAKDDQYYSLYVVAVTTGLRLGELLGLQWSDVDLDQGLLQVRRTLYEVNGRLELGEPKSESGRRLVTLPSRAKAVLLDHWRLRASKRLVSEFVFTDTVGGPIRSQNMTRRSFKPLLQKAGLPEIRFHDLRHTHASILLQAEVNPKLVQERLGHSSINLTLGTYSHVLPNMQKQVAQKLDSLF